MTLQTTGVTATATEYTSGPATAPRTVPGVTPELRARLRRWFAFATRVSPQLAARLALELFVTPPRRKLDAVDVPVVARATRHALAVDSDRVAALEWMPLRARAPATAPEGTLQTVLLLHGWGSHAARFGHFIDPLTTRGFRVVGLDAPAHGDSTGRRCDLSRFRAALRTALAEFAPVTGIVAHSMGASAAVWQLADEPHPDVRALVVVGMPRDVGYMLESFALVLDLRADVTRRLRSLFTQRFGAPPEHFSAHALAGRLSVPTLVVHDRDDDVAPAQHAREFAARLRNPRLRETGGLHHSGALRDSATIDEIVEFLSDTTPGHRVPREDSGLRS
jgi:pimeloyl-ACP methyl ester carboxylesterase